MLKVRGYRVVYEGMLIHIKYIVWVENQMILQNIMGEFNRVYRRKCEIIISKVFGRERAYH